jgi:hypothetical protein
MGTGTDWAKFDPFGFRRAVDYCFIGVGFVSFLNRYIFDKEKKRRKELNFTPNNIYSSLSQP